MKKIQPPTPAQFLYSCPDEIVSVVRKTSDLKRDPPHDFPCVLFLLKANKGTRVQILDDGTVEFMASWNELRAFLVAIHPEIAAILPPELCNKPRERMLWWRHRNKKKFYPRRKK